MNRLLMLRVPSLAGVAGRTLVCALAMSATTAIPLTLLAQSATSATESIPPRTFDIPAQPLLSALREFSRQSSVRLTFDTLLIAGLSSRAVIGTFTVADALRQLLFATGIAGEWIDGGSAVLRKSLAASAGARLAAVRVVAPRRGHYAASGAVSGMKTSTPLRDIPQAVTIVTRDLIGDQAMRSMADVVRYVPGVTMGQGEGNRDQPTIRGNASTADFFVDGVRDDAQYFRDLYNLERVEALKGSNAMIFGRGGGGGVLNRVSKEAQWAAVRELTLQAGSFDNRRVSTDLGEVWAPAIATRFNAMYERSGFFRHDVRLSRYGINPTLAFGIGGDTKMHIGYEYFSDHRTADRGIPSFQGRPLGGDLSTFFGSPAASYSDARVNNATATIAHETNLGVTVRNRTRFATYDKIYQNVFPGAVNAAGDQVSISAYNNAAQRRNLFNQTDLTYDASTGSISHTLLLGAEAGRQLTDNFRNTGYFNNVATTLSAPVSRPTVSAPVTFRQSTTDADNHVWNTTVSLYAQDEIALARQLQLIAGLRLEHFAIRYHNNRTDSTLHRRDRMLSPRAGLVFKPLEPLSIYTSYSVSYLPSAGDQFSSLTDVTKGLEPERFTNYEVGAKWELAERLALSTAIYQLDRTNTRAPDPRDPTRTVQTGSQRTKGFELGVSGNVTSAWEVAGAFANQDAFIMSTTSAAVTGARVPLVPRVSLSLWNKYQVAPAWAVGLGVVHRSDLYAAIDNKVTLPRFTEVDGAFYLSLGRNIRAQANLENLLNTTYYLTANGNNNITPGSPRSVRVSLSTSF